MNKLQLAKRRAAKVVRSLGGGVIDVLEFIPYVVVGGIGIVIRGSLRFRSFMRIDAARHGRWVRNKVVRQVRWFRQGWLRSIR